MAVQPMPNVVENHVLMFGDAVVRVEVDGEGNCSIWFEQQGNDAEERDYPISFDSANWHEVKGFWDRVTCAG